MTLLQTSAAVVRDQLEYPACPVCQCERRELPFRLSETYSVARCLDCQVHYLYPRLAESKMHLVYREPSYYHGGESGYADTSYVDQEPALRATFRKLLRNLAKRGLCVGDLLEVGCGYGYLLDEARSFFRHRAGTEFSPEGAEIARGTGAEVWVGGVEQLIAGRSFDCVIATQVIEHVYDPLPFLRHLVSNTKSGGHIILATPDIGGALRKFMGRSWPSFKVPEHVVYFDFSSLAALMQQAGLREVKRLPYPHAFPFSLIAAKFGLTLPASLGRLNVWVPATTIAAYGRVVHD